jgi:hypothetical protein
VIRTLAAGTRASVAQSFVRDNLSPDDAGVVPFFLPLKASWRDRRRRSFSRIDVVLGAHTNKDGATIFWQACKMGLEGIVSKRLGSRTTRLPPSSRWRRGGCERRPQRHAHTQGRRVALRPESEIETIPNHPVCSRGMACHTMGSCAGGPSRSISRSRYSRHRKGHDDAEATGRNAGGARRDDE